MPTGLDGNPNPVVSESRSALLGQITAAIPRVDDGFLCVGVDGRSGAGKSTLADELARRLRADGVTVVRSTTDSFHNPRALRYRSGMTAAQSYFRCSHDLDALRESLLEPFLRGDPFRVAVFDEPSDEAVESAVQTARPGSVLVFDGLFLHRPELRDYWELSVFLDADVRYREALEANDAGLSDEQMEAFVARYVGGWELYLSECEPRLDADVVVDNNDFASPRVVDAVA